MPIYTAVDLGATSGRIVNVHVDADTVRLDLVSRFPTIAHTTADGSTLWDYESLRSNVRRGLVDAASRGEIRSVAIDTWAVDYGLLDDAGSLVGPVHSYRSARTNGVMEQVGERLGRDRIYGITGIQFLPFNTIYQLAAARDTPDYASASRLLMLPDLLNHDLCGSLSNDLTNASTTQLLDATTRQWSTTLLADLGLRRDLMPALHEPGTRLGEIRDVAAGIDGIEVVAAASHDTASAVAGTPLHHDVPGIYISCGTWSLVGCERPSPITTHAALAANVTNELGVGGTTRLLKNVTGLWLLEQACREWEGQGIHHDVADLVAAAAHVPGGRCVIDPDDSRLASPGPMATRIVEICQANGAQVPTSPEEITRVILDSLALAWRRTVRTIEDIAGFDAAVIHLVGGGSANTLLGELCASACERRVVVGPTEATVVGNMLVQAIADGAVADLASGRELVNRVLPLRVVEPAALLKWDRLERHLVESGQGESGQGEESLRGGTTS
ncbi:MAG: rhamnulokinase family protein [Ilumatobacteraceae bacterium]